MLTTNTKFQKKNERKKQISCSANFKKKGMQIKVPFRDIAIIIIICNRESFIWLKFHARIFVFLAHFADNLAHLDINLRSGSPAKNNSCSSYHIGMELTALSLKCFFFVETCSFWGLNWVWSGSQYIIPDICHFFLENKIYTEKTRKLRQNTQKIANFFALLR